MRTLQELQDLTVGDRAELLTQVARLSPSEAHDIEVVLDMIPSRPKGKRVYKRATLSLCMLGLPSGARMA